MGTTAELERTKKFEQKKIRAMPLWAVGRVGNIDVFFVRAWSGRVSQQFRVKMAICIKCGISSLERS